MATEEDSSSSFITVLLLSLIILKVTGIIGWSWFWVLTPLWYAILLGIVRAKGKSGFHGR